MKTFIRFFGLALLVMALATLAVPGIAWAQDGQPGDQLVLGDNYTLASGESVGNLTVLGGNVLLETGSTVSDQLVVFGGNVTVNGTVKQSIHVYGGQLTLGDTAVINGNVELTGGNLSRAEGAQITGSVTHGNSMPFDIRIPNTPVVRAPYYYWDDVASPFIGHVFWFLMQTIGLAALAVLVILFAPKATERVGDAAMARPWAAGGLGLLVAIVTPPLLIGFALTLIGIPVTILLAIALAVVTTFGWIALGLEVGKRLAQAFNQNWPAVVSAGLGTLLLSLVANGIGLTPCVGWIVPTLVGFVGMGGVLLSRFGTYTYPTAPTTLTTPTATPPAPAVPA